MTRALKIAAAIVVMVVLARSGAVGPLVIVGLVGLTLGLVGLLGRSRTLVRLGALLLAGRAVHRRLPPAPPPRLPRARIVKVTVPVADLEVNRLGGRHVRLPYEPPPEDF